MRKKTIYLIADKLFWCVCMLLPLLVWVVSSNNGNGNFASVMAELGISSDNIVYQTLNALFGSNQDSVIHLFTSGSTTMLFFTYFIILELVHLFVDFILFIPRLANKWMSKFTRSEE